jgi:hypothetical protein
VFKGVSPNVVKTVHAKNHTHTLILFCLTVSNILNEYIRHNKSPPCS